MTARTRRRLLVLASTYPRWAGDTEPGFVHELARRLLGRFEVTVLCPHAPGAPPRERLDGVEVVRYRYAPERFETLVNDGGIVSNLRRRRWMALLLPSFGLAQAWYLWRCMRRWKPDVIHAHWLIPQGALVALLNAVGVRTAPFLVTSHGADLFALRGAPFAALKRFTLRRAAGVSVVSEGMRQEIQQLGADASRVRVAPMGVDLETRFTVDASVPRAAAELLFVGRLVEKKGLRYLLDAMPAVLARRPDARLTIAGFGPEEAERKDQAVALGIMGNVDFVGAVSQSDLPALYRRARLFVAPFVEASSGDQEGLGLVMIEAAACGCRIVAGDVRAVRDVMAAAPIGVIVPQADAEALAQAILRELDSQRDIDAATRQTLHAHFGWRAQAAIYADLLDSIAKD